MQGAYILRDPSNTFDTLLSKDVKDSTCHALAPCVVDLRSVSSKTGVPGVYHCFVYEPAQAAAAIGIRVSSLPLFRELYGDDDEPALVPDAAYGRRSPYVKFQYAINGLESVVDALHQAGHASEFPDVTSVLMARIEGDPRVQFSNAHEQFWAPFYGADDELDTDEGKATRAYAHTILNAYKRFRDDAPRRTMTPAIMSKVQNAGLPSAAWGVINNKAKALDPSLMP